VPVGIKVDIYNKNPTMCEEYSLLPIYSLVRREIFTVCTSACGLLVSALWDKVVGGSRNVSEASAFSLGRPPS